jgi:predicted SAM-dependent methyltransferase
VKDSEHSFCSTAHYATIGGALRFVIKSRVGRMLRPLWSTFVKHEEFLNIGCGGKIHPGWTNLDFYVFRGTAPWVQHDLRFPLPFKNEVFRGVFSEHCIEHLHPADVQRLFREILRVLRTEGVFRCVVPDLAKYIAFYNSLGTDEEFKRFANGCEAIWNLTQNWGHLSVWDTEMLREQLLAVGFDRIDPVGFRKGSLEPMLIDQESRRWESLYIEAHKR